MNIHKFFQQRALGRELTLIIIVKLIALTALWYFFVKDHKVPHDASHTAAHVFGVPFSPTPNESK